MTQETELKMPPEIAKAIIGVMAEVKKLAKEGNNTFQRYKYTSVDQFYEALGSLMAAHGIFDVAIERSTEVDVRETVDDKGVVKKSLWLSTVIDFMLYHESGISFGPLTRHIQVPAAGAQSYASAQSYAEKYFLRNLFKVPTGDVDEIDSSQQAGLPTTRQVPIFTPVSAAQAKQLDDLLVDLGEDVERGFLKYFKIGLVSALPASEFGEALRVLMAKKLMAKKRQLSGEESEELKRVEIQ